MNDHILSAAGIFDMNARLVRTGLSDLSDEDATKRTRGGRGSSMSFVTGHMLLSRFGLLKTLGLVTENPYSERFGSGVEASDGSDYPDVGELSAQWEDTHGRVASALSDLTEEDVLAAHEGLPVPDQTVRGAIMFRAWHESYHVGQIGLLRTELGLKPLLTLYREQMSAGT